MRRAQTVKIQTSLQQYKYSSIRSQNVMCSGSNEFQFTYRRSSGPQRNVSMAAERGAVRPSMSQ